MFTILVRSAAGAALLLRSDGTPFLFECRSAAFKAAGDLNRARGPFCPRYEGAAIPG